MSTTEKDAFKAANISDEDLEQWFDDEEDNLGAGDDDSTSNPQTIEQKYAESQLSIVRTSMDFSLHTIRQTLFESSYINRAPEYQRRHRWDDKKRSLLIESILMNIPIPPLFLFENDYNKYEVMDGRQRLDTVIEFLENGFYLRGLEFWKELNGKRFKDLSETIQRGLLRRTLSSIVLLAETARNVGKRNQDVRMVLFRRLNTGGVMLNPQELRNALYPSEFNKMLREAARGDLFTKIWGIPPKTDNEDINPPAILMKNTIYKSMADCELVLRVFAIREMITENHKGSLRSLLDKCMERHQKDTKESAYLLKNEFHRFLEIMFHLFEGRPFRLPEGRISRPLYDALMVALSLNPQPGILDRGEAVRAALSKALTDTTTYEVLIGRGNTTDAIKDRVDIATRILSEA